MPLVQLSGSAVVQTFRHQLTLFHAICVIHLLTFLGLTTLSSKHDNNRLSLRGIAGLVLYFIFLHCFVVFSLFVWLTASSFGSQPQCNASTIYVLFGAEIPATSEAFRLFVVSLTCLMLLCIILFSIRTVIKFLKDRNRTSVLDDKASNEDYVVLGSLLHLGGWIYAVTAFEQNLHFNNLSPDEFEWSFGQILALVLLIGPLFDLCTALHDEPEPKAEMQPRAVGDQNLEAESEQGQNADRSQNDKKLLKRSSVLPPSGDLTSSPVTRTPSWYSSSFCYGRGRRSGCNWGAFNGSRNNRLCSTQWGNCRGYRSPTGNVGGGFT
jgi:hypothetical protein